jgi:hypothetical protein
VLGHSVDLNCTGLFAVGSKVSYTFAKQNDTDLAGVLHDANCAVWTAVHTEDPQMSQHADYQNILCAIETVHESVGLIRYALDIA